MSRDVYNECHTAVFREEDRKWRIEVAWKWEDIRSKDDIRLPLERLYLWSPRRNCWYFFKYLTRKEAEVFDGTLS